MQRQTPELGQQLSDQPAHCTRDRNVPRLDLVLTKLELALLVKEANPQTTFCVPRDSPDMCPRGLGGRFKMLLLLFSVVRQVIFTFFLGAPKVPYTLSVSL